MTIKDIIDLGTQEEKIKCIHDLYYKYGKIDEETYKALMFRFT